MALMSTPADELQRAARGMRAGALPSRRATATVGNGEQEFCQVSVRLTVVVIDVRDGKPALPAGRHMVRGGVPVTVQAAEQSRPALG